MKVVRDPYQDISSYWKPVQFDFLRGLRLENRVCLGLWIRCRGKINERKIGWSGLVNKLCCLPVHDTERCSQDFMSVDQIAQTILHDLDIERSTDTIAAHV